VRGRSRSCAAARRVCRAQSRTARSVQRDQAGHSADDSRLACWVGGASTSNSVAPPRPRRNEVVSYRRPAARSARLHLQARVQGRPHTTNCAAARSHVSGGRTGRSRDGECGRQAGAGQEPVRALGQEVLGVRVIDELTAGRSQRFGSALGADDLGGCAAPNLADACPLKRRFEVGGLAILIGPLQHLSICARRADDLTGAAGCPDTRIRAARDVSAV